MKKTIFIFIVFIILHSSFLIHNCPCQWEPDVRLTTAAVNSYLSLNNAWCIASAGTNVYVVWCDNRDGNFEIYYMRSTNDGINWGAGNRLTNNSSASEDPAIAVSGSNIHIVWSDTRDGDYEIYYKRSTNEGLNWGTDTRLTNSLVTSWLPSIAVSGSNVYTVWTDFRNNILYPQVYFKRSTNGGVNWEPDIQFTFPEYVFSYSPSIAVSGSNVHVSWTDNRDGNHEIYYKNSTNNGLNWTTGTRLTNNSSDSRYSSIAVNGLNIHIIWVDNRDGNSEIYYKRSMDGGTNWGADTRLTTQTDTSEHPSIAVSGSNVHIVWSDYRDGNREIYYKESTNNGINWTTGTRLTNNSAESIKPFISISGSIVHVVWEDSRNGNYNIYYKRNPTGNSIGIKNISSEVPEEFTLEQNYPNPFNSMTNVKFQMLNAGNAKIIVFDLLGREVAILVNEKLQAGTYEVRFDAGNLPSGIYFYQLKANNFIETKKLILLK